MPIRRGCASVNRVNRVQGNQRGRETRPVAERAHRPLLFIRCSQIGPYAFHRQFWRNFQIDAPLPFPPPPPLFIDFSLRTWKRVRIRAEWIRLLKIVAPQTLFWIIVAIFFVPDRGRNWEGKSREKVNDGLFSLEDYCRGRRMFPFSNFHSSQPTQPSQPRRNYSYVELVLPKRLYCFFFALLSCVEFEEETRYLRYKNSSSPFSYLEKLFCHIALDFSFSRF